MTAFIRDLTDWIINCEKKMLPVLNCRGIRCLVFEGVSGACCEFIGVRHQREYQEDVKVH